MQGQVNIQILLEGRDIRVGTAICGSGKRNQSIQKILRHLPPSSVLDVHENMTNPCIARPPPLTQQGTWVVRLL